MHQRTKIAVAVAMALNSLAVYAQVAADAVVEAPARIEVTGSRIRQVDLETAQPVLKMTAQQIQATGLVTVGDILNQMTAAAPPSFSKGATLGSDNEQGGQYIDMRNLGAERLLVLVDGKRWTQSVNGYTDISTVPSSMIERIEILKDGASAIYGSDAIAGVVNIILKKTMVGGSFSAYTGQNEKGDGKTHDYSFAYGAGDDKASLMFALSHNQTDPVWAKDRDITSTSYGPLHPEDGLGTGQYGRIRFVNSSGGADTLGPNLYLNHSGNWRNPASGVGADSRDPANYHAYAASPDDTYNSTEQMMFQSGSKLTTLFTKGEIQLPQDVRFKTTAMYSERTSVAQNAGYPLNSLTQSRYPVYIDKDSYYNPYGSSVAGAGNGQDLFFYRRTVEVPRVTDNKSQTLHIDATLSGSFALAGKSFDWSTGYNHSQNRGVVTSTGNINLLNLKKAVGPSFLNANGVVQCGTATAPIALGECTPLNILGGPSASTQAGLDYIMSVGQATYGSTTNSATADISGEIFTLPAGAVGIAGGLEHREVRGYDTPGQFEQSGFSTDLASNPTKGRYTVKEAYLEANIPLLKDQPFARLLSANVASRFSDYSNFGTTTNSKVSFMWKPVNDLLARATWAEGFRAPALGDTFGGGSQSYDTFIDICDSLYGQAGAKANCAAAGVPSAYRQTNAAGTPVPATGAQSTVPFDSGVGNSTLSPETAKTKTIGLVYSPSYVPGLTTSLDWFKIQVNNRITSVDTKYTLEQCYLKGNAAFCDNIKRDATGAIVALSHGNMNLGKLETEGVDIGINYRLPRTPYGVFGIRSESTWLKSWKRQTDADSAWDDYTGEYGYNRLKSNLSLDWSMGNWSSTYTMRYQSGVKDGCFDDDNQCSDPKGEATFGQFNKIGSTTYSDLNVAYATPWKGKIMVGANNVWNKSPRIVMNGNSSGTSVDPDQPIDRFFYVRYNQAF